jgi:flagellin
MRINTNVNAMNAQRNLGIANAQNAKSLERLSSGLRINRAADDAAGLSISEKMRGQVKGLTQASRNAQDGISMIQTAEGALNESHTILQRMNELGVQGANGSLSSDDRKAVVSELKTLRTELNRISATTDFNGTKLLAGNGTSGAGSSMSAVTAGDATAEALTLAGTYTGGKDANWTVKVASVGGTEDNTTQAITGIQIDKGDGKGFGDVIAVDTTNPVSLGQGVTGTFAVAGTTTTVGDTYNFALTAATNVVQQDLTVNFQIGANTTADDRLAVAFKASSSTDIGNTGAVQDLSTAVTNLDVATPAEADFRNLVDSVQQAIKDVSANRSNLGSVQNRLEHTIANIGVASENLSASESRIRDLDMAAEVVNMTKSQILGQAGTAILAQANQAPQNVMSLLR